MEAAGALQVWPQFRGDNDSACDGWRSSSSVMSVRSSYFCVLCMWTCSGALLLCERVLANCHDLLRHLIELSPCQCYWSHLWFSFFDKSKCRLWKGVCEGWMVTVEVRFCRLKLPETFSSTKLCHIEGGKNCSGLFVFLSTNHNHLGQQRSQGGSDMHLQNNHGGTFCMRGSEAPQRKRWELLACLHSNG